MWRLKRIVAENLCAFRLVDYSLPLGVTTLVFGDNRDNDSQGSNGSGKSALLEGIAVGICGSPMRRIKNEEVIRDDAEQCRIVLTFDNNASDEVFTIERQLTRKGHSVVICQIDRGGKRVETDEAVQPSIDAYNRFIAEKLGISREELYNNFLLSKYKYSDFLSSSDKDKKELINRFSNGNLVDQAIERLVEDEEPISIKLREAELESAGIDGRIEMLQEQIENEEKSRNERNLNKETQKNELENRIIEKRSLIRECGEKIVEVTEKKDKLKNADSVLQSLENKENSLEECLTYIRKEIAPLLSDKLTNWEGVLDKKRQELHEADLQLLSWDHEIERANLSVEHLQEKYASHVAAYNSLKIKSRQEQEAYDVKLKTLDEDLKVANHCLREMKQQRVVLSSSIDSLRNKLGGSIICPSCGHEFLTAENNFSVKDGRVLLECSENEITVLCENIVRQNCSLEKIEEAEELVREGKRRINGCLCERSEKMVSAEKVLRDAKRELDNRSRSREITLDKIGVLQEASNGFRRRMFDELFGLIDETYQREERHCRRIEDEKRATESAILTMRDSIKNISESSPDEVSKGLKLSLKNYRIKSVAVMECKSDLESSLLALKGQEQLFIQFKGYLANTKIQALSKVTNEFLESTGSDIRICFSGYTVLKTGKIREKISITLMRDGVDCGSFGKFSAGEAARVNLATILAMQKLINGNCEGDQGLDLLVLDEILEAVDEEGLSSMFRALNKLGITSLVVSHGNVAEGYPHKLIITKEHGESKIA